MLGKLDTRPASISMGMSSVAAPRGPVVEEMLVMVMKGVDGEETTASLFGGRDWLGLAVHLAPMESQFSRILPILLVHVRRDVPS